MNVGLAELALPNRRCFAQWLVAKRALDPGLGGVQQRDCVGPVVDPKTTVVEYEIEIEPRLLNINGNERLFRAAGTRSSRGEVARGCVFPCARTVRGVQIRRRLGLRPEIERGFYLLHLVGNRALSEIDQLRR